MALRHSKMLPLGTRAPEFALPDTAGKVWRLGEFAMAPALLVAFISNHCPYVKHILDRFVKFAREYEGKGLAVVAISSNDIAAYPEDAPAEMARVAAARRFSFPYLFDKSQEVAKAYQAVCTPDFFLFDQERRLVYRGQFDASRPGNKVPVTGEDLRGAVDAMLGGERVTETQIPSAGCNIKWQAGNEPEWG